MDYNDRPPSDNMVDIHVYLVPVEFWREQLNSAVNQIIEETISIGFVRVYPDSNLQDLRKDIAVQLSDAVFPSDYTFLRSVGRCLTRVQAKQETQLKAKNYIPPQAYAPEIFILEGPPDNRSSVGHPFSRWSGDRSVQNSSDTVRTSRSDGPYKRLPAISNSRNQSPADQPDTRRNHPFDSDESNHSDDRRQKSSDGDRPHDEDKHDSKDVRWEDNKYDKKYDSKNTNRWDDDRWEQRPNSNDENRRPGSDHDNYTNRERTLPPLSASPTQIDRNEESEKRDDDRTQSPGHEHEDYNRPPLSATPPHSRHSSPKTRRRSRSTNSRREASDSDRHRSPRHNSHSPVNRHHSNYDENNDYRRNSAWQDSRDDPDRDRYDADKDRNDKYDADKDRNDKYDSDKDRNDKYDSDKDRYEDHSHSENDDTYNSNRSNDGYGNNNNETRREFSSIQEENEDRHSQYHRDNDNDHHNPYATDGSRSRGNSPNSSQRHDDSCRQSPVKDKDQLMRDLEEARRDRQEVERKREELVRRAKHLQSQTQTKRSQARDVWKKKYFEEKKKTPPLEEQVNRMRTELENLHHRIISQLEGSKEEDFGYRNEKPSNFNNLKLQATKASHEITDLQRRVENVKMKLTGEIKLRKQAEVELKALKAEQTQKKINLSLSRNQQLHNNNSTLSNSYNGFSSGR